MRSVTVVIPGRPPGANELIRMGHWRIGRVREEWRHTTHHAAVHAMTSGPYSREWILTAVGRSGRIAESSAYVPDRASWWPLERARVAVEWRCKTKRRRDFDNAVSGIKPCLDALVSAGILRDDSSEVIIELGPLTIVTGTKEDQTVLTVTEV